MNDDKAESVYYFCIPAYNEARTVGVLLWKIRKVLEEYPRDYRILVLDDASTDATPDVLEPYARVLPLKVIRNQERQGYAASLERMLREVVAHTEYPRRDAVIVLQADFTDEPESIPELLKGIESGADVVSSSVRWAEANEPRFTRWTRKLVGYMLRRFEWPEPISDPLSGFRAYRIVAIKKALAARDGRSLLQTDGWAANVELLHTVIPFARRVDEVEVGLHYGRRWRPTRFRPLEALREFLAFFRARSAERAPEVGGELGRGKGGGSGGGRGGNGAGRGGGRRSANGAPGDGGRAGERASGAGRGGRRTGSAASGGA